MYNADGKRLTRSLSRSLSRFSRLPHPLPPATSAPLPPAHSMPPPPSSGKTHISWESSEFVHVPSAGPVLGDALRNNKTLAVLKVKGNLFGADTGHAFANGVRTVSSPTPLLVYHVFTTITTTCFVSDVSYRRLWSLYVLLLRLRGG